MTVSPSPAFTVLMPVLNAMPFLEECLDSLARQSRRDFELYAWVNGSTDGSIDCLHRWIPGRLPGKVIRERPLSLGESRAALIEAAPTEACALMDADDRCPQNRFQMQFAYWRQHPEMAFFGGRVRHIDSNGKPLGRIGVVPEDELDIRCCLLRGNAFKQNTIILKKSAVMEVGNFRDLKCEDYDLQLRIASRYHVANMAEVVCDYRIHEASTSAGYGVDPGNQEFAVRCLAEHAPRAYGVDGNIMEMLRRQKIAYAFPYIQKIAQKIATQSNRPVQQVFRNRYFHQALAFMIQPNDWKTHLRINWRQAKNLNWLRRIKQILQQARSGP